MTKNNVFIEGKIIPKESYEVVQTAETKGKLIGNLLVTLRITDACDLKCSYCFWNDGKHFKYEDIITSLDKLFEFFVKQKIASVRFYFHGGEAPRHPRILDILKHIKHKSAETGILAINEMQTNLTLKTEKFAKMLQWCDQLNMTFHYTELKNKRLKLDFFNKNWDYIVENNIQIHNFDVMLEPIPDEELEDFYRMVTRYLSYPNIENSEMIYAFGYSFDDFETYNRQTIKQHQDFYKKYNKTEQQYRVDGQLYTTNDFWRDGLNCVGWHCNAGISSFTVNGDGNVFNCGIQMTYFTRNPDLEKPYTNLVHDRLAVSKLGVLHKTGTICRWAYCGGDYYFNRRKRK